MERIIVRRGRIVTYELLRKIFGGDPNVEIIWDRRRPSSDAPPIHERRSNPPAQWYRLDYLFTSGREAMLAPPPSAEDTSANPQNRSSE
jgi:hypothetical protein